MTRHATALVGPPRRQTFPAVDIAPDLVERAAESLTDMTGLTFPDSRRPALYRALIAVAASSGSRDVAHLTARLDRQPGLVSELVAMVRIGETYFFRHPEQLAVIAERILPALTDAAAAAGRGTVGIWSAGCSTGEEAYSLAILGAAVPTGSAAVQVRVAATDIDPDALRVARAATYGRWSFRSELADRRAAWFKDVEGARRVHPSIVERVTFSVDNLSHDRGGLPAGLDEPPGLIVCRNVTMYLSVEARRRVAERFLRSLAPGGWLVVAPVELSRSVHAGFDQVVVDGQTFYRRPSSVRPGGPSVSKGMRAAQGAHAERGRVTPAVPPTPAPVTPRRQTAARRPGRPPLADGPGAAGSVATAQGGTSLAAARALADQGSLADARQAAEAVIRSRPGDREGYLLMASIAEAQDDLEGAVLAMRRLVYLDRSDPAAQFHLGLLEWRLGRDRQARARLDMAVRLVQGREAGHLLDATSELTVERLRSAARMLAHG